MPDGSSERAWDLGQTQDMANTGALRCDLAASLSRLLDNMQGFLAHDDAEPVSALIADLEAIAHGFFDVFATAPEDPGGRIDSCRYPPYHAGNG